LCAPLAGALQDFRQVSCDFQVTLPPVHTVLLHITRSNFALSAWLPAWTVAGICFVFASEAEGCHVSAAILATVQASALVCASMPLFQGFQAVCQVRAVWLPSVLMMQDLQRLMADKEASKQEAIQDAVAKAAEEKQKAAAQADQVKLWFAGLLWSDPNRWWPFLEPHYTQWNTMQL